MDTTRGVDIVPPSETRWSVPLADHTRIGRRNNAVRYLARAWARCPPEPEALTRRAAETFGREWRFLAGVALRFAARFAGETRPRRAEIVAFLLHDHRFCDAVHRHRGTLRVAVLTADADGMQPAPVAEGWGVPALTSVRELAVFLRLSVEELEWFADLKGLNALNSGSSALCHYHFRAVAKRSGGVRLLEAPKERLKTLQRALLRAILDRIPPHPAAHGFVPGRSILSFAAPHAGSAMVLRMDLQDFFPSVRQARVEALFRTLGYPEPVADMLSGLVTVRTPRKVLRATAARYGESYPALRDCFGSSHLPQGAPTSPALANACAYRLDCRLAALAERAGAAYTRYADDLAFSGGRRFAERASRFSAHVAAIAREEGLEVNHRKTLLMPARARQKLVGLVINQRPNVSRGEYDNLKATLTNCLRTGPQAQNRESHAAFREHLAGRIAFVSSVNRARGERLQELFRRITWN